MVQAQNESAGHYTDFFNTKHHNLGKSQKMLVCELTGDGVCCRIIDDLLHCIYTDSKTIQTVKRIFEHVKTNLGKEQMGKLISKHLNQYWVILLLG